MDHRGQPRPELDALRIAYTDLASVAVELDEAESWSATGCAGWAVRDVVFHLLCDAQRALVALATPAPGPPDRDAVTYWRDFRGAADPESRSLRATRTVASAWRLDHLVHTYRETAVAVVTLAERASPDLLVATQGHELRVGDLLVTLTVEAAVHHLDLVASLDRHGPDLVPLGAVRETLDGLLGRPGPAQWDDVTWALIGTGRRPLDTTARHLLGSDADRLPLLS